MKDIPATIQLRQEVSPKTITIGDLIKVETTVVTSSTVVPAPFKPGVPLGEFEIRNFSSTPPKTIENGKISITHSMDITTFSTGTQTIPSLTLAFQGPDGTPAETKTEEVKIEVRSLLMEKGDEGGLRPLKGLYNFPSYLWLWILLALLAAAGGAYWIWKHYKKRALQLGVAQGPPKPPEQWAWENLHKLEDSDFIEQGKVKEYYSELSFILRGYLERRYQVSALERTSAELLADFRKMNHSPHLSNLLKDFLETGDLVKFAKYTPATDEIEKDLLRVKEAITITTPVALGLEKKAEEKIPV